MVRLLVIALVGQVSMPSLISSSLKRVLSLESSRTLAQEGILAPQSQLSCALANTTDLPANQAYYGRFIPQQRMTAAAIAFRVLTAAGSNDPCDVALYNSARAKIVSSGATVGKLNATGSKTVAIAPTVLLPGNTYYVGFSCGAIGTTAARLLMYNFLTGGAHLIFAAAGGITVDAATESAAHPLPATMVLPAGSAFVPVLGVMP